MLTKKRSLSAFDDNRYLLDDGSYSLAYWQTGIPARVNDLEDYAQDGVVMSRADALSEFGRSLPVSDSGLDETMQKRLPSPLTTITCSSTAT